MTKMERTEHCELQWVDGTHRNGWAAGCSDCADWVSPQPRGALTEALHDAIAHEKAKHPVEETAPASTSTHEGDPES